MNWWWFGGDLAAIGAGTGAAVWLIRRLLAPRIRAPRDVLRLAAVYGALAGCMTAAVGLFLMWRAPYLAPSDFLTAGFCLTLAGWYTSRWRRLRGG